MKEQLAEEDRLEKQLATFDPLRGNRISVSYMSIGSGKNLIALSHPAGPLDSQLRAPSLPFKFHITHIATTVVSPMLVKQGKILFQPQANPIWTSETPICQVVSSSGNVDLADAKSSLFIFPTAVSPS